MTTYIKKKGGQTLNEQLCLCKSLTTWYFYDMFMRMSAIFMTILSFMAVVMNVHCLNSIIFQLYDMSKVITQANYLFKMHTEDPVAIKPFIWRLFKYEAQIYIRDLTTLISLHLIQLL